MKRILTLFFCVCSASLFAQQYNFKNYTVEDGLAQSQINDINQDELGYLWIGTESGLSKFNGLDFVNYSMGNGLPDNKIEKIFFQQDNTLWVGTPNGLARFENGKFIPYFFDQPRRVNDIEEFQGFIYVATNDGLLKLEDEVFSIIDPYREDPLYIRALVNDNDEVLICGTKTGLYNFTETFQEFEEKAFMDYNISDIEKVNEDLFVATYGDGLIKYSTSNKTSTLYDLGVNRIRSIYADETIILCSSISGAIEINQDEIHIYDEANGLINESLVCIFKDREGNYWLGTDGNGLLKFLGKSIISYSTRDGLSSSIVMSITQDHDSSYIFGTYREGISKLSKEGDFMYLDETNGLTDNTVWTAVVDTSGSCWVGTTGGVSNVTHNRISSQNITAQIEAKTRSIVILDDKYFFGGTDGIYVMSGGHVLYLEHTSEMNVNDLCAVNGDLYVASTNGLYLLKKEDNYSSSEQVVVPEPSIYTLTFDSRDYLWIGTENGLFIRFPDGKITPFELDKNDFKSKTVLGILESVSGNIWTSTMSGAYQIELLKENSLSYKINHYSTEEGLTNLESNLNSIYEDYEHKIWIGTSNGLAKIDPSLNEILFDFRSPELHFTGIRLFMEEFDYNRFEVSYELDAEIPTNISLPYDQNHLTFDFIGINLKNPESVFYEYRLSGANETWSPLTQAKYATYSDISPGDYVFEVRATNKTFEWSEVQGINITIRPPYWKTWWFIISLFLVSFLLILLLFQARIRTIKQRQENEKLGYKNRLLFLEQQSLNASMNRHFIFNSLNSIQYFINSSDKLSANRYLSSFAKLIRKNLDSSSNNNFIVTLQEEIERIELYLTLEKMRFQEKFDYKLTVSSSLDTEGIEIPSMILQPFVENSIIHGVLPLDKVGLIEINIFEEYDEVIFEVIDDGVGIDNTLKNKKASIAGDHESRGMDITSRRIELLRKLTDENLMIIGPYQLNDEGGKSIGTKVIIKMGMPLEL